MQNDQLIYSYLQLFIDSFELGVYVVYMIRKNIHLTTYQINKIKKQSKNTGISSAELIRRIIDSYFECQKFNQGSKKEFKPVLQENIIAKN